MITKEWKEFHRSSLLLIVAGLVILSAWFVLFQYQGMEIPVPFRTMLVSMFEISIYFLPLLAMIYGGFSIVFEKSQQTLAILISRGLSIREFVYKKFMALLFVFVPVIVASYFIGVIPAKFTKGNLVLPELLLFLVSMAMLGVLFIGIGIMIGSLFNHSFKFIGATICIWLFFVYLYDLLLMFWLPYVSLDGVFLFSIMYFLSPINAVQYFFLVKMGIYQLSDLGAMYNHFTFQSPGLVLVGNMSIWLILSFVVSVAVLKRKGVSHA